MTDTSQTESNITPVGATLELDLAFPTPNEAYRRVYPFPIVFAFQGMKVGWPHHIDMIWELVGRGPDGRREDWHGGGFPIDLPSDMKRNSGPGKLPSIAWTNGQVPNGEDTFFFIVGASNVLNSTVIDFTISYSLRFHVNCTVDETTGALLSDSATNSYQIDRSVTFSIDNEKGLDPALVPIPGDNCPASLATIRIKESLNDYSAPGLEPPCAILDDENLNPEPSPCLVKPPSGLQSSVSSHMLETARCTTGSWPAETLVAPCDHDMTRSEGGKNLKSGGTSLSFTVAVVMLGSAMVGLASTWVIQIK